MDEVTENDFAWFSNGLRFKCTGCGKCCTGASGYVFLTETDIEQLATHLSLSPHEFMSKYTRFVDDRYALLDALGSDHCIFLKNKQCTAYDARPVQCKTFPWWVHNLKTPEGWKEAAEHCEGINHPDAPIIAEVDIKEQCITYLDSLLEQNFVL